MGQFEVWQQGTGGVCHTRGMVKRKQKSQKLNDPNKLAARIVGAVTNPKRNRPRRRIRKRGLGRVK